MPKRLIPKLSDEEFKQLAETLHHSPKPYLRERAGAILKLANSETASKIATSGLLRKRHPETVSRWFHRFQTAGVKGLEIKVGRGRKPAFSPSTNSQ